MVKKLACYLSPMLLLLMFSAPIAKASTSNLSTSTQTVITPQDVTGGDPEPPPPSLIQIVQSILPIG